MRLQPPSNTQYVPSFPSHLYLIGPSARPVPAPPDNHRRSQQVGRRVCEEHPPPCFHIHRQCKRVPCTPQDDSVLYTRVYDSMSFFLIRVIILDSLLQHYPNIILSGVDAGTHSRGGEAAYMQYVQHLEKTSPAVQAAERAGTVENFAQGYQDYLQAPLQVRSLFLRSLEATKSTLAFDGQFTKCHISDV